LLSVVMWWHTLVTKFALALQEDAYTHILLIVPVSVALIVSDRRSRAAGPEPNLHIGLVFRFYTRK